VRSILAIAAVTAAATLGLAGSAGAAPRSSQLVLVELVPSAACTDAALVAAAGGTLVAPELALYTVPEAAAGDLVATLGSRGTLRFSEPNGPAGSLSVADFADPLVATEWWRAAIGIDGLTPPGPGKPITIVDSGIDVTHPDFLERANTETLNAQEPAGFGGEHGTAVGSLVAAPANGVGVVGVYPEAVLRSWDAAKGAGTQLDTFEIVQGILAAARSGPGVVNLSLGADEKATSIEQAIYEAVSNGVLVVAASGNDGDGGSPLGYPASIPHVLTVGATDPSGNVAAFSSRSRFVDLAAPGVAMPIATALGKGWREGDGTSFAAPLVSGAAAWIWTVRPDLDATQLFEVMRRSAVDVGVPGRDDGAGFGLLNVPAALAYPAPVRDPFEPNDDLEFVKPDGFYDNAIPPLTTPARRKVTVQARVDRVEDPSDVYRVWLPKNGTVTATLTASANLDLGLWARSTVSIDERIVGRHRLARAVAGGTTERLRFVNAGPGRYAYLAVVFPQDGREATYSLRVA
jgi:subtilisin family serine protease